LRKPGRGFAFDQGTNFRFRHQPCSGKRSQHLNLSSVINLSVAKCVVSPRRGRREFRLAARACRRAARASATRALCGRNPARLLHDANDASLRRGLLILSPRKTKVGFNSARAAGFILQIFNTSSGDSRVPPGVGTVGREGREALFMKPSTILLLDFHPTSNLSAVLCQILEPSFCVSAHVWSESAASIESVLAGQQLPELVAQQEPAVAIIIMARALLKHAEELFRVLKNGRPALPIIAVPKDCEPDEMLALLRYGAVDFITPPLKAADVLARIWRLLEQSRREETLALQLKEKLGLRQLVGESPAFLREVRKFPLVAKCDASVLISGETGTGKEVCARAIHYLSPRARKPFIPVNCGAIPTELVENELFGHERGAYTGASSTQLGLIHEANGGTLFLDEIDSLPLLAQVKLLRFLQEKEYRPLGATKMCKADVRIIAASNSDFEAAVAAGRIRRDLYYRLNVVLLTLPPLRERPEDIALLARHFLAKYTLEFEKEPAALSAAALHKLQFYEWPGNVRELENTIERAVMLCESQEVGDAEIVLPLPATHVVQQSFQEAKAKVVSQFEKSYIQRLLIAHQGNITRAAQTACKDRRAFWHLIRKHKIDVRRFKTLATQT
jgi:DNA-binding NtrC family response regulator